MRYAVVVFVREDKISVVRRCWLLFGEIVQCSYPPANYPNKLKILLQEEDIVPPDTWEKHEVRVLRDNIESWKEATRILSMKAKDSEAETTDPENLGRGKRSIKKVKLTSDEEEVTPVVRKSKATNVLKPSNRLSLKKNDQSLMAMKNMKWPNAFEKNPSNPRSVRIPSPKAHSRTGVPSQVNEVSLPKAKPPPQSNYEPPPNSPSLLQGFPTLQTVNRSQLNAVNVPPAKNAARNDAVEGKIDQVLKILSRFSNRIATLTEGVQTLKEVVEKMESSMADLIIQDSANKFDIFRDFFPLHTEYDLKLFNDDLSDPTLCTNFKKYLYLKSKESLKDTVRAYAALIFTNELANCYSWKGHKRKSRLDLLKTFADAFIGAVQTKFPDATDEAVLDPLKKWLAKAVERMNPGKYYHKTDGSEHESEVDENEDPNGNHMDADQAENHTDADSDATQFNMLANEQGDRNVFNDQPDLFEDSRQYLQETNFSPPHGENNNSGGEDL